jgi:hypothetical protein
MATLEHEQLIRGGRARSPEAHVFVSHGGRRQRVLPGAGVVAGALALVWLVALGLAMAGSTRLPDLPLLGGKRVAARDALAVPTSAPKHSQVRVQATRATTVTPRLGKPRRGGAASSPVGSTASAPAISPTPAAPSAAPSASVTTTPPVLAATPTRGWARRGLTTPPGQTNRNEPTPRGLDRSTDGTTTSTTHGNGHGKG